MLAELTGSRKTIAIAGTHGKTTTTAMTAAILERGGFDPTYAIGGLRVDTGTNAGSGRRRLVRHRERRERRFVPALAADDCGGDQRRKRSPLERRRTAGLARAVRDVRAARAARRLRDHRPRQSRQRVHRQERDRSEDDVRHSRRRRPHRARHRVRRTRLALHARRTRHALGEVRLARAGRDQRAERAGRDRGRAHAQGRLCRRSPRRSTRFAACGGASRSSASAAA